MPSARLQGDLTQALAGAQRRRQHRTRRRWIWWSAVSKEGPMSWLRAAYLVPFAAAASRIGQQAHAVERGHDSMPWYWP